LIHRRLSLAFRRSKRRRFLLAFRRPNDAPLARSFSLSFLYFTVESPFEKPPRSVSCVAVGTGVITGVFDLNVI